MPKTREKYVVFGVDLYHVRNRNEQRVVKSMTEIITAKGLENEFSSEDVKDIYAYALNQLEARYAQQGTIVLRDPIRKEKIDQIVAEAVSLVLNNPKDRG
ncbi:MAG: late competence development ComFB family protein [Desulfovibrionaceae bacterium]|nr:late competence development ComFB family protein [Desulfovibrionaceae bacterium]